MLSTVLNIIRQRWSNYSPGLRRASLLPISLDLFKFSQITTCSHNHQLGLAIQVPKMRPPPDEEVPEVPKGLRIIFHLIRHGQAKHDDMHNNLTEKERLSLEDPKLTNLGIKQAETLGKNFPRLPFITSIFSSPSRRCIQTALHVLDPILGPEVPINVSPFFRELSKFKCDQPLPRSRLQEKFKKENCIEWALLESQQDLWQCDARGYARVTLKEQAELCRKLLYETGQMYIKEGRLNAEGNVEIVVIGHVLLLNAIMGNTACKSC